MAAAHSKGSLQAGVLPKGYLSVSHLPEQDPVREDITPVIIALVGDDLRGHATVGARLGRVLRAKGGRDAEIGDL